MSSENNVLISVIIPVYNVEKYVERSVLSVCNQTYKNIEIVIAINESSDNSEEICHRLASTDKRIKVYKNPESKGLGNNRNFGVSKANGHWFVFVDSDDVVHPEYVNYLYTAVKEKHCDFAVCKLLRIHNQQQLEELNNVTACKNMDETDLFSFFMDYFTNRKFESEEYLDFYPVQTKIYNRYFFEDGLRFNEVKYGEDLLFQVDLMSTYPLLRIAYVNEPLYFYNMFNETSLNNSVESEMVKLESLLKAADKLNNLPIAREILIRQLLYCLRKSSERYKEDSTLTFLLDDEYVYYLKKMTQLVNSNLNITFSGADFQNLRLYKILTNPKNRFVLFGLNKFVQSCIPRLVNRIRIIELWDNHQPQCELSGMYIKKPHGDYAKDNDLYIINGIYDNNKTAIALQDLTVRFGYKKYINFFSATTNNI